MRYFRLLLLFQLSLLTACPDRAVPVKNPPVESKPPSASVATVEPKPTSSSVSELKETISKNFAKAPGPGYETVVNVEEEPDSDFRLASVFYQKIPGEKVLGSELIAFQESKEGVKLLWRQNVNDLEMGWGLGDPYHIDFNRDGKKDIFLQSSVADTSYNAIFINDPKESNRSFIIFDQYSEIVDLNEDGVPEILYKDPVFERRLADYQYYEEMDDVCISLQQLDELRRDAEIEYSRVAKAYHSMPRNFEFPPDNRGIFFLHPFQKIIVKGFDAADPNRIVDQTGRYTEHIRWRIQFLEKSAKYLKEMLVTLERSNVKGSPYHQATQCQKKIQLLIHYFQSFLSNKKK